MSAWNFIIKCLDYHWVRFREHYKSSTKTRQMTLQDKMKTYEATSFDASKSYSEIDRFVPFLFYCTNLRQCWPLSSDLTVAMTLWPSAHSILHASRPIPLFPPVNRISFFSAAICDAQILRWLVRVGFSVVRYGRLCHRTFKNEEFFTKRSLQRSTLEQVEANQMTMMMMTTTLSKPLLDSYQPCFVYAVCLSSINTNCFFSYLIHKWKFQGLENASDLLTCLS